MAGIGIIKIRKAQGKKTARKKFHPQKRTIKPASTSRSEERDKNNSAPSRPTIITHRPKARIGRPVQEGRRVSFASSPRSCQTTKAENRGTKNPWEKLGSCDHCKTRCARVDP